MRSYSLLDRVLTEFDQSLRTVFVKSPLTERPYPAENVQETTVLSEQEQVLTGRLMRINHAGEVSAQGLYRGQALTAHSECVRERMARSAAEENDHLDWCERRLENVGAHKSFLNPVWYWGSFSIGACAGLVGDKWSLGFVDETEQQVVRHLEHHINQVSPRDLPSQAILQQMKEDELHHADAAVAMGAAKLPWPIRKVIMPLMSKVMTKTTYWV